ncbi:hypothetical protein DNU06_17305 [Putridiphycobacter roseus]|uniref:Haem-binding uptake Tiki superfamily ChaN domain-containing protein n=1 Tax=Putridiphycobacter roseus TaxID=2219161 RepID=A0A2W1NLK3_9FLAO|nr:hypothetical protein DNU06_17305 [Putridiphycobacter roseus]
MPFCAFNQDFGEYIKENAIEIDSNVNSRPEVYAAISKFELIMVGEMHGTQEPAGLVDVLAKVIVKNEGFVSVGLEIPTDELSNFIKNPTEENLLNSVFFSKENIDGRNGQAWFDLILNCTKDTSINLFFFDNVVEGEIRDSIMYLGILNQKLKFPESKIITISGNIHNWSLPYNDMPTMGMYCLNDTINFTRDKACSINHAYSEGTLLNNTGNGLEMRTITFKESVYSKSVEYENYLLFYKFGSKNKHNCLYYSKKVNHSAEVKR